MRIVKFGGGAVSVSEKLVSISYEGGALYEGVLSDLPNPRRNSGGRIPENRTLHPSSVSALGATADAEWDNEDLDDDVLALETEEETESGE